MTSTVLGTTTVSPLLRLQVKQRYQNAERKSYHQLMLTIFFRQRGVEKDWACAMGAFTADMTDHASRDVRVVKGRTELFDWHLDL